MGDLAANGGTLQHNTFIMETALHASDISNATKAHPIMLQWTRRVLDEFWNQGDEERALGVPISPLCDREEGRKNVPKGQVGFINFIVQPLMTPITELFSEAAEAVEQLSANKAF